MSRKSIEARVQAAFADAPESIVIQCLTRLRENMDAAERASRRTALQHLLLIALFILLVQDAITEATFLSFRVNTLEFLVFLIPIATAYIGIQWPILIQDEFAMADAHDELIRLKYPKIYEEDLELLLSSPTNLASQAKKALTVYGAEESRGTASSYWILAVLPYAPAFFAQGIIIYEIVQLFVIYGAGNAWVWASAVATVTLAVAGRVVSLNTSVPGRETTAGEDAKASE